MSADNWTICPRCRAKVDKLNEARIAAPGLAYGKVSQDKYARLVDEAKNLIPYEDSLREDYEIGIVQGKGVPVQFYVSYSGQCDCGFAFSFNKEQKIDPKLNYSKSET